MATRALAKGNDEFSRYVTDQLTAKRQAAFDQAKQEWQQGERDLAKSTPEQRAAEATRAWNAAERDPSRFGPQPAQLTNYTQAGPGYSWDQFEQAARGAGLYDKFSEADLALARSNPNAGMSILSAKQQYGEAQSAEAKAQANARAEAIRSSYGGYTGGTSGSYYNLNPLSPIQYQDSAREQQTRQRMEAAYQKTQAPYDPTTDPAYIAYRKQHLREGQRATQDTMAAAAMMTGGRPSSYAVTAAGQQGNYYAAQLTDKIPQLYEAAYSRAMQEYQQQANQYNQDRAFGYGQLIDEVQNQRNLRDEENQARQQALANALKAYELGDSRQLEALGIDTSGDLNRQIQQLQIDMTKQQMQTNEWQQQLQQAQLAAGYGDYSQLEAMGFDVTRADFQNQLAVAQLIAQYTGDVSGLYALLRGQNVSAGGGAGTGTGAPAGSTGKQRTPAPYTPPVKDTPTVRPETVEQAHGYDRNGYPSTTGSYGSATGSSTKPSSGSGDFWSKLLGKK